MEKPVGFKVSGDSVMAWAYVTSGGSQLSVFIKDVTGDRNEVYEDELSTQNKTSAALDHYGCS